MVWAKNYNKNSGSVIVLTGDGDPIEKVKFLSQCKQIFHQKINNLNCNCGS